MGRDRGFVGKWISQTSRSRNTELAGGTGRSRRKTKDLVRTVQRTLKKKIKKTNRQNGVISILLHSIYSLDSTTLIITSNARQKVVTLP